MNFRRSIRARAALLAAGATVLGGLAAVGGTASAATATTTVTKTTATAYDTRAGAVTGAGAAQRESAPQLHVVGNRLVDRRGRQVVLRGVDRSGAEYMCVQDRGIFDGPADQASITAMKTWDINAVRVPLNEACWNGESYVDPAYAGTVYRQAIEAYVHLLNRNGLVAILDLHWTDGNYTGPVNCGSAQATCQKAMPDAAQSIPFWHSVARAFRGNDAVVFDLFNEPYPDIALGSETAGWACLLKGGAACTSASFGYQVAGMQSLVHAVRSAGAGNVIMVSGLTWTNDLTQLLQNMPFDPRHNLAASWHSYNFNGCSTQACWESQIAPVIARVPLIAGEIGESDCSGDYITPLMNWLDSEHTGYLAWTWDNWNIGCGPVLITDYNGDPTPNGAPYRDHLLALARG